MSRLAVLAAAGFVALVAGVVWAFGPAYGLMVAGVIGLGVGLLVDMG